MIHALLFPSVYNLMRKYCSSWLPLVSVCISVVALHWGSFHLKSTRLEVFASGNFVLGYHMWEIFVGMLSAQVTSIAPRRFLLHKIWWFILVVALPLALDPRGLWISVHSVRFFSAPTLMWSVVVIAARCV